MKKFLLLLLSFLIMTAGFISNVVANQNNHVAVKTTQVDFYDADAKRPAKVTFWHQVGESACQQKVCLSTTQSANKVAVISHGAFGSPHSMNWLGYALASQGFVVAGVAHYGESWVYGQDTIDPSVVARFWQRPQEVSFVIDQLANTDVFNVKLQTDHVLMLGHSSGGFTTLALAGAKLQAGKSESYCALESSKNDKGCNYASKRKMPPMSAEMIEKIGQLQAGMKDPRIAAVIALDPALGHATNTASLKNITIPSLVIGSVENDFLPYAVHAKYYADHIPNADLVGVKQGAGHFVYIDACDSNREANGVPLCKDRQNVNRKAIQQQLLGHIFKFVHVKVAPNSL